MASRRASSTATHPTVAGVVVPGTSQLDGVVQAIGLDGGLLRVAADAPAPFVPRPGPPRRRWSTSSWRCAASDARGSGDREVWLSRDDPAAERALTAALADEASRRHRRARRPRASQRCYAGDGAVLALRLLLVCGAAAVLVAVGALLVAAYVGRRQRAYEVAALRVVGVRRRTVRALLLRENVGTVSVALVVRRRRRAGRQPGSCCPRCRSSTTRRST